MTYRSETARRETQRGGGKRTDTRRLERVRGVQLLVCLALFLSVFIGQGVFPDRMEEVRRNINHLMTSNMDWRGSLEAIGQSFLGENKTVSELEQFCIAVFGAGEMAVSEEHDVLEIKTKNLMSEEIRRLGAKPTAEEQTDYYLEPAYERLALSRAKAEADICKDTAEAAEEETAVVPAAGTILLEVEYTGRALPNNYTMDQLSLGELDTVTPVVGHLNSEYGYRDHPVNGVYQFHGGVDIGGQKGDPIAAFADGVVEYIGEDKSYGLYLQLDHGNGVKSFYAHCNKLLVSKGDVVTAGETIAEVGASGTATGPHLHLELKYGRMHLNPAYYLSFLAA